MTSRLVIPNAVSPPAPPRLARVLTGGAESKSRGFPKAKVGEIVNVTNALPDGSSVWCVACAPGQAADVDALREGWLPASAVEQLEFEEVKKVPAEVCLNGPRLYKRLTFACVLEDWQDIGPDPSTLRLLQGELLQVSSVKADGWAYGWSLETPSRRGWFPISLVQRLDSSLMSLLRTQEQELPATAQDAVMRLLKSVPLPPAQDDVFWEGDLPPLVADSVKQMEQDWREKFEKLDAEIAAKARSQAAEEMANANDGGFDDDGRDEFSAANLFSETIPDDAHPLYVCKLPFKPGPFAEASLHGALLALEVGDLVRVTTLPTAQMLFGFVDGKSQNRGWFPSRCVNLVCDPLNPEPADALPAIYAPPPLPVVPPFAQRAKAGT